MLHLLQSKINRSNAVIEQMLSLSSNPYLALSFGKDSLVMYDLVKRQKPNISCLFLKSEESYLLYNYEEVIEQYLQRGINLEIVDTSRISDADGDWATARKVGRNDFFLEPFCRNWNGVFMGLRIEEGAKRRISLCMKANNQVGDKIMQYKTGQRKGMYRCCPMAYWTAYEIILYLQCRNLPYLDIYKQMNGHKIRTTARLTGDAMRNNSLSQIRIKHPENWNKLARLIPELNSMVY